MVISRFSNYGGGTQLTEDIEIKIVSFLIRIHSLDLSLLLAIRSLISSLVTLFDGTKAAFLKVYCNAY